jgi:hypothetical protein
VIVPSEAAKADGAARPAKSRAESVALRFIQLTFYCFLC